MKVAILGDLHIGLKKDDAWTANNQKRFFKFFFASCKAKNVKAVIQTGDWFDVRSAVSQRSMQFTRTTIVPGLSKIGHTYVIVGNHDMHYRQKITPNSCTEILGRYNNKITVIEEPTTITLDGVAIDLIPWICQDNVHDVETFIQGTNSQYCVGHFELKGFYYYTGLKSEGESADFLKRYKQVWSGHFHCQSSNGNVQYVGTPYTLTHGDANDSRGFYIFDTVTHQLEYVENPECNHKKIYFNADDFNISIIDSLKGCAVRVVVEKRTSDKRKIDYDVIVERIASVAHELDIIDNVEFVTSDDDEAIEIENTIDFVNRYIDSIDESTDIKTRCKSIFSALYVEAIEL